MPDQLADLVLLFAVMILQVVIPPLPAELIVASAGNLYGTLPTVAAAGSGLYAGSVLVYFIGKYLERKFSRFFNREKTQKVMAGLRRFETAILWVRILPYNPSDLISYAAGILRVRLKKFLAISLCTSFLRTLSLALLGGYISNIKTLLQVLSILFLSALIGAAALYGSRRRRSDSSSK